MVTPKSDGNGRWAPWWAYVIPILALNYLRQALLPRADVGDAAGIGLALTVTAAVVAVVTTIHRLRLRG